MIGDKCYCSSIPQQSRERDRVDILRNLTECLQDRNRKVEELQDELKKVKDQLYQERKKYQLLMRRCDSLEYNLMCSTCRKHHSQPRYDGDCFESFFCDTCKPKLM